MIYYIDKPEDFIKIKDELKPVYINSKKFGKILVPCMNIFLVKRELIVSNNYNPNSVSPDRMELLKQSILDNGWCYPIIVIWSDEDEKFIIIDGFHRDSMGDVEWLDLDYIPLIVLGHDITKRMMATVAFNKARGVHSVELDADLIRSLIEQGMNEQDISIHLGIDIETIHRYKSLTGIANLFKNVEYSLSWEMKDENS